MAAFFPAQLISHTRRVCSLYKRSIRNLESKHNYFPEFRYRFVLMRQRFEENRDIKDMRVAHQLLLQGEQELFDQSHPHQIKFRDQPGGITYERAHIPLDLVMDYWHPLEKAQYPKYFERREQRKKEYIAMWEREFGKPSPNDSDHH